MAMMVSVANSKVKLPLFLLAILLQVGFNSVYAAVCEYSVVDRRKLYHYSLASPVRNFAHGVLSEDGFYKVSANDTILWFQLCDGMIVNHDPPKCVDCLDCGGSMRCGMGCSAVMANNIGGYYTCEAIKLPPSFDINLLDKESPHMGVVMKFASIGPSMNCSLLVSVVCNSNVVQGPESLQKVGACDYATVLQHPAGCAVIVPIHGKGWGLFGNLLSILLCLVGAYLLAGMAYRFFFLRIGGVDVIPNLDFWTSIPHRTQSLFMSAVYRFRGSTNHHRNSYSPVNF
ncbi:hypothetical protein Nepgr_006021 [Nepenthes gracilis]|uniref:Autophagy-related protein 27 n=1 Tax=Nepenthes gracilis TaxID=150966 RepID=A0AAD3XGZ7_NEPGR|nr:hypothetical protein Nepgr_006021 [Nepenthes gracilis]